MEQFSTLNAFSSHNKEAYWLYQPVLQKLLTALEGNGDEARIVGGAVRNTLLDQSVYDIDIATTALPEQVIEQARNSGFKAIPIGIEFGTVIVVAGKQNIQVTTLRSDIETDGRHAKVRFCRDWAEDASRRDFTINALYVDKHGQIYDYVDGIRDLQNNILRFIGNPVARIKEDYLRILRFFRFYALFPQGRPERDVLKAIIATKSGMDKLSAERIWDEFKKILATPAPFRSLLWMRTTGVLEIILGKSIKWGIDAIQGLKKTNTMPQDALLRFMTLIPPRAERIKEMAKDLKLSGKEKKRLLNWANATPIDADITSHDFIKKLYYAGQREQLEQNNTSHNNTNNNIAPQAILDVLNVAKAYAHVYDRPKDVAKFEELLNQTHSHEIPVFPIKGIDLKQLGFDGAEIGQKLKILEEAWLDSNFVLGKQSLLDLLHKK